MAAWTDERIDMVRAMVAERASASEIARELNVTRNAVIGIMHRKGIHSANPPSGVGVPGPRGPQRRPRTRVTVARIVGGGKGNLRVADLAADIPLPEIAEPEFRPVHACGLLDLTSSTCRWPVGDPQSPDFYFCGGDAVEPLPYCAYHARRAYDWASTAAANERRRLRAVVNRR